MTRTRLAAANMATRLTLTLVTVLAGFLSTPLLLSWLGKEAFGAFTVAQGWLAMAGVLELGFASALSAVFAARLGGGDRGGLVEAMAYALRIYLGIATAMMLVGALICVSVTGLMKATPALDSDLRRGVVIGVLSMGFILATPFRVLLDAQQRGAYINLLLLLQALLSMAAALLFGWLGWGIVGQFAALGLGAGIFAAAIGLECLRRFPELSWRGLLQARPRPELRDSIWRISGKLSVNSIATRLNFLTDGQVIGKFLGAAQFVPYSITRKLGDIYQQQLANVGNATWAALAELHAQGHRELLNRRVVELTSLISCGSLCGLLPIAVYNKAFVALWVGSAYYGGDVLSLAFLANAMLFCVWSFWIWVLTAAGKVDGLVSVNVGMLLVNLPLTVASTWYLAPRQPELALCGPLIGNVAGFVGVAVWRTARLLQRHFGIAPGALHRALWSAPLLAVPCIGLSWWTSRAYPPSGWLALGCSMAVSALVYAALAWLLILDPEQKALLRSVGAQFVPALRRTPAAAQASSMAAERVAEKWRS